MDHSATSFFPTLYLWVNTKFTIFLISHQSDFFSAAPLLLKCFQRTSRMRPSSLAFVSFPLMHYICRVACVYDNQSVSVEITCMIAEWTNMHTNSYKYESKGLIGVPRNWALSFLRNIYLLFKWLRIDCIRP